MRRLISKINGLCKKENGVSALEYGVLVALIAAVIIGAVTFLGGPVSETSKNAVKNAVGQGK